ncbi:MAG: hypothetical protein P8Y92_14790 [Halioglobus sp.]
MVVSARLRAPSPGAVILRGLLLVTALLGSLAASGQQQLEQEPIVIKGDQRLPRTIYIAPWKRVGKPLPSDVLDRDIGQDAEPLERDLFLRELELYRQGYSVGSPDSVAIPIRPAPAKGQ